MASRVEVGLGQDGPVAVDGLEHLGLIEGELVGSDSDHWSVLLMRHLDCVRPGELGHVVESPAARQPAQQRSGIPSQRMQPNTVGVLWRSFDQQLLYMRLEAED